VKKVIESNYGGIIYDYSTFPFIRFNGRQLFLFIRFSAHKFVPQKSFKKNTGLDGMDDDPTATNQ
jgi:hypothetical protein